MLIHFVEMSKSTDLSDFIKWTDIRCGWSTPGGRLPQMYSISAGWAVVYSQSIYFGSAADTQVLPLCMDKSL